MKVNHFKCGPAVNESERTAFDQIKTRLISVSGDGEWWMLTNLTFSFNQHRQSDEIDIVMIGPPGVRVIEVKHWTADWVKRNRHLVEQEAERVTSKVKKIGTTLKKKVANLGWVEGVFLLTEAAAKVKGIEGKVVRGVRFHTLKTWQRAVGLGAPNVLPLQQIRRLSNALEPRSEVAASGALKRLAGYVRLKLQTPPEERFHRVYQGVHATKQNRVVLHLYDLSATGTRNAETRAEREFEALQRLQLYPWAPRIRDSFQAAPGYPGEIMFFTMTDPAAPCVEERAADDSWDTSARLHFARHAIRALGELHAAGTDDEPMVHRNLTPRTVLVKHDSSPILTGFEHTRIPAEITVAPSHASPDEEVADAVAPEVRAQGRSAADRRSDVYSLCASLATLFAGRKDLESRKSVAALARGTEKEPKDRSTLEELEASLSELLGESAPPPPPPPARYWTEDQVVRFRDQDYRIDSRLGSGGVGTTFKVVKLDPTTGEDLGTYVAKVVHDRAMGQQVLRAYERAHSHLRHPLSTIFEVAPEWRANGFVALMTWIEGEPLGEFSGLFSILAEDLQDESGEALALRWLRTACEALGVLHRNDLVHGDVSPHNLIVSDGNLVLTDYDLVGRVGERAAAPGTVRYCAPSYREGRPAAPSDDLYALAASFFHVLFDKEPFRHGDILAKERGLSWEGVERAEYGTVAAFLDRATDPDPEKRFATVADAMAALKPPRSTDSDAEGAAKPESDGGTPAEPEARTHVETGARRGPTASSANRLRDLERFYHLLNQLESHLGGWRRLSDSSARTGWPVRGVYFFFEEGEARSDSGDGLRVVHVGTHALKRGSATSLWKRLAQHRGTAASGGGNHRGSIFRLLTGTALMQREPALAVKSWGRGSTADRSVRRDEHSLECRVSDSIGRMPLLWLAVPDESGPDSLRGFVERNTIALLSNHHCPALDPPSGTWLGRDCSRERVRRSGLWNNNHVDEVHDPSFLNDFERLVSDTGPK